MVGSVRARSAAHPLPYRQGIDGLLDSAIGSHGLSDADLQRWLAKLEPELDRLWQQLETGSLPLLRVPEETADIAAAEAALANLSAGARTIVFFGTGGSSLGGQTLAQLSGWFVPGAADERQRQRPRTRFYDNLDADTLARAMATLDLASTRFVVTSKSGNTPETLVQAMVALDAVSAAGLGRELPRLFLGLTEPAAPGRCNGLRRLFEARGIPLLDHHTGIGGRYSVLTNVGLLPALARGLDVRALRAGAAEVVEDLRTASQPADLPAAIGAAVNVALARERGVRISVMMPYADRLARFAHWYVQLWAESLGKNGEGTTPLACLGPLDQHSQLQLFMDGPREHLITVLRLATSGAGPRIDSGLAATAGLDEMAGRSVGDLVAAQAHGVPEALAHAGRPVRTFDLDRLDERTLGALLMHFMLETILAGRLFGVDPFDQPAVELGKRLSRQRLQGSA
ncbi:MAG: glucose-6-phosphate isomerase [Hyphomicrobiaceae bacterium]|nr:glucose-6-phosphate isomerase [Hyphomicrobiaceae bacterium]